MTAQHRQRKHDRLTYGRPVTQAEIECDFACAPLDRVAVDMDRLWGVDRLVELMPPDIARKYGARMAELNAAIDAHDADAVTALVGKLIANMHRMGAIAREAGHAPLVPDLIEFQLDGKTCAILRDGGDWAAAKAQRPDVRTYTLTEVANALAHYGGMVAAVKDAFPVATVSAVRNRTELEESLDDEIPF